MRRATFHQTGFTYQGERDGHFGGRSETFDKLEEYLSRVKTGMTK